MDTVEKARQTQLENIQKKTGKSLDELTALVNSSGLSKHSEIRSMLQKDLELGYGDANTLTLECLKFRNPTGNLPDSQASNLLDDIYSGAKSSLRPIHERLMEAVQSFGDFEVSPKKGYISLRRKKQFATIGPATNTRVEVGINHKSLAGDPRLIEQKPGSMCNYTIRMTQPDEVDDNVIGWIRQAYESAG
jgi:hypothetical protein